MLRLEWPSGAVLFAESGDKQFFARRSGKLLTLKGSQAVVLGADCVLQTMPRPPSAWPQTLPWAFRDTLPPKAAHFEGPALALKARAALSYAALQPCLTAEGLVRRDFPPPLVAPPPTFWDPALLAKVELALAKHVGPLAAVLARRAAKECQDLPSLQVRLAEQITSTAARDASCAMAPRAARAQGAAARAARRAAALARCR